MFLKNCTKRHFPFNMTFCKRLENSHPYSSAVILDVMSPVKLFRKFMRNIVLGSKPPLLTQIIKVAWGRGCKTQ